MSIAKVVQYRALSQEQRAENAKISGEAISLARAADTGQGNAALDAVLQEITEAGGFAAMPRGQYERLRDKMLRALSGSR
jgi:hypothetical protein